MIIAMQLGTAGAGPALFRLVRFWSRRWARGAAGRRDGEATPQQVQQIQLVEALDSAAATGEVTVASVAYQLGVDRSVASRMITDAAEAGYVERLRSPNDARRARLWLTRDGLELLAAARAWQDEVFGGLIDHWPAEDQRRFAGYLRRFAREVVGAGAS